MQRDQLLQKLNEYAHRKGQLERYSTGAVEPESAHPDAEQHLLYNNQWRVDQNIRDTRQEYKYGEEYTDSDEEEEDDDEEAAEIRLYLAKAHVRYTDMCNGIPDLLLLNQYAIVLHDTRRPERRKRLH